MIDRPPRTGTAGSLTRVLRWLAGLGATGCALFVMLRYKDLPDQVPVHFGFDGRPDTWGDPSGIAWITVLMVVLTLGLVVLSHYPRIYNYPVRVTAGNAQGLYVAGERMMSGMAVAIVVLFAGAVASMFGNDGQGHVLMLVGMGAVALVTVLGIVGMVRAGRRRA